MTRLGEIITAANDNRCDIEEISGFVQGAQWADAHPINVWHEASEKPRAKEWILVQFEEDEYQTLALSESGVDTWFNDWVDEYRAIRWAYIKDLLPKGGEQ